MSNQVKEKKERNEADIDKFLLDTVSRNLKGLMDALGMNQKQFAEMMGVAEGTISGYLQGSATRGKNGKTGTGTLPSVSFLYRLISKDKVKPLQLTLDTLMDEHFDPVSIMKKKTAIPTMYVGDAGHKDFLGNYYCYYFDTSTSESEEEYQSVKELRYGVLSVYSETETRFSGVVKLKALAAFFKQEEQAKAISLKTTLDAVFAQNGDEISRNKEIKRAFTDMKVEAYDGAVSFTDKHTNKHVFINIQSENYGDNALIVLNAPPKKADNECVGGLACVASVTRGRQHLPAFHKIILSKYEIKQHEELCDHLFMRDIVIDLTQETQELCEFCEQLYSKEAVTALLDRDDKSALLERRLRQLLRLCLKKNACSGGIVTPEEDYAVYKMIVKNQE